MWVLFIKSKDKNYNKSNIRFCNSHDYSKLIDYIKKYYNNLSLTRVDDYNYYNDKYYFNIYMSNNLDKFGV